MKKLSLLLLCMILALASCSQKHKDKTVESNNDFPQLTQVAIATPAPEETNQAGQDMHNQPTGNTNDTPAAEIKIGKLTKEELKEFTDYFMQEENIGFLTCVYTKPEEVDLNQVLYGLNSGTQPSNQEEKLLDLSEGDNYKYPTSYIRKLLQDKMGITLQDVSIKLNYPYLPAADAYFLSITDTNRFSVTCVSGNQDSNSVTILYTTGKEDGSWEVTLKKAGNGYHFYSNINDSIIKNTNYVKEVNDRIPQLSKKENSNYVFYYDNNSNNLLLARDDQDGERSFYFQNTKCIEITLKSEENVIGPTLNNYEELGDSVYQEFLELFNTDKSSNNSSKTEEKSDSAKASDASVIEGTPYPFDQRIPDQLLSQQKKIATGKKISLPKDYSLLDSYFGDLNQDGQEDMVVAVEQAPGLYTGSRGIYIFLQKDGTYHLKYLNTTLLLGKYDGGVFGEPYAGMSIADGNLHIYDYGGSADRWGHDYTFAYDQNNLFLTRIEYISYSTLNSKGTKDTYDLLNGQVNTTFYEDNSETEEVPADELLLYSGYLQNQKRITFSEAYAWCEKDFSIEPNYPQPSLWNCSFGEKDYTSAMKYTAEDVLDLVWQKFYPDMKKVTIPYTEKIRNNNNYLLGYEVPGYYYRDGKHILCYFELSTGDKLEHTVYYYSIKDDNDYKFYWIYDDTGVISN